MATLKATTKLDSTGFNTGVDKMKKKSSGLGATFKKLGGVMAATFSVGAVIGFTKAIINMGSKMTDLADQSGLTLRQFQALNAVSIRAGVSSEKVQAAMAKISVSMGEAMSGAGEYVDMFQSIGLTQEKLATMNPAQVFEKLAQVMSRSQRGTEEYGAALQIIGTRSGAKLVEVMRQAAGGLDNMADSAANASLIMEDELVKSLDKAADDFAIFWLQIKVGAAKTFSALTDFGRNIGKEWAEMISGTVVGGETIGEELETEAQKRERTAYKLMEKNAKAEKDLKLKLFIELTDKQIAEAKKVQAARDKLADKEKADSIKSMEDITSKRLEFLKKLSGVKVGTGQMPTDSLAKIGGTLGGQASPEMRNQEKLLNLAEARNRLIENQPQQLAAVLNGLGLMI